MAKHGNSVPDIRLVRLSQPARHALQGLLHLASLPRGAWCQAGDAARARRLPAGSLAKTFQRLAHRGLLEARRGRGGGYSLAADPKRLTLAQIVDAAGEDALPPTCLMEDRPCGGGSPCAMHEAASAADRTILRSLRGVTLAKFAAHETRRERP